MMRLYSYLGLILLLYLKHNCQLSRTDAIAKLLLD
jgi:hypothetical protein